MKQNVLEREHFVFTSWLIHEGDFDLFFINTGRSIKVGQGIS